MPTVTSVGAASAACSASALAAPTQAAQQPAPHPRRTGTRYCCSGSLARSCYGSRRGRSSDCCSRSPRAELRARSAPVSINESKMARSGSSRQPRKHQPVRRAVEPALCVVQPQAQAREKFRDGGTHGRQLSLVSEKNEIGRPRFYRDPSPRHTGLNAPLHRYKPIIGRRKRLPHNAFRPRSSGRSPARPR